MGGRPSARPGRPLAAVALVVVLALSGTALAVGSGDGGSGDGGSGEDDLLATVEELTAFVEEARGLEFLEPVDVELADDEEFEQRLLEDFDEGVEDMEVAGVYLTALGLISPDLDLMDAMEQLYGGSVVGFYDPETGELVVRGGEVTPYVRSTIVHELVHALDDQHFELHRPDVDEADDESSFGFSALVEGNARRIEDVYMESLGRAERVAVLEEQFELSSGLDLSGIPFTLVEQLTAPYELGQPFVDAVMEAGGQERLDDAFAEPPVTSEQVIAPGAYLRGEGPVEVPVPEAPVEALDDGAIGQYMVIQVLAGELPGREAGEVAAGWGGDWAVAWRDGDRSCVRFALVGDTPADTAALQEAFTEWAGSRPDASVEAGATPEAPFTTRACAG